MITKLIGAVIYIVAFSIKVAIEFKVITRAAEVDTLWLAAAGLFLMASAAKV